MDSQDFDAVSLGVASPERIMEWSFGEVTKPETINYRTQRSEKSGLFDEKMFALREERLCHLIVRARGCGDGGRIHHFRKLFERFGRGHAVLPGDGIGPGGVHVVNRGELNRREFGIKPGMIRADVPDAGDAETQRLIS